jgi:MFS family permease
MVYNRPPNRFFAQRTTSVVVGQFVPACSMSGRRDPPAGAWLCDALCFPSATALRERLAADEQRRPLLGSPRLGGGDELSVSELRWWALIVFSTMSAVQNAVWISFSVVVEPACGFFSVDTSSIHFLASLGPLVLIPVAFITGPLSRSMGLRAVVVIGCALTALGAVLRVPAIFLHHHRYAWAVLGHAVNAAAGPVIMSCPPLLSSTWFPLHERTTATAIAYNAQIFGIAFGWAAGPYIVTQASEIPRLIWLEAAFGIATLLVGVTFPPAPATAPTVSAGEERVGFWAGVAILLRRPVTKLKFLPTLSLENILLFSSGFDDVPHD